MDKPNTNLSMRRRELLKFAAVATSTLAIAESSRSAESDGQAEALDVRLPAEPAGGAQDLVTTERRGQILLIGLNRQAAENRLNPASYAALAKAYYTFDKDPTLRAAILFGHGKSFCAGIDAEAFAPIYSAGSTSAATPQTIDPFGKIKPRLSKPLVVVAHGNTFNAGHEIFLAADIRLAAVDTKFGQMENTQARIPGGGATVRFVHEAGWGNAMRYMLTGDSWTATEAKRMGTLQEICPTRDDAILLALQIASRIAACGPLSIKTTSHATSNGRLSWRHPTGRLRAQRASARTVERLKLLRIAGRVRRSLGGQTDTAEVPAPEVGTGQAARQCP